MPSVLFLNVEGIEFKREVSKGSLRILTQPVNFGRAETLCVHLTNLYGYTYNLILPDEESISLLQTFEEEGFFQSTRYYVVSSQEVKAYCFDLKHLGVLDQRIKSMREVVFMEEEEPDDK